MPDSHHNELLLPPAAVEALDRAEVGDPFALLGPHPGAAGTIVRVFLPQAQQVEILSRSGATLARPMNVEPSVRRNCTVHCGSLVSGVLFR